MRGWKGWPEGRRAAIDMGAKRQMKNTGDALEDRHG